MGRTVHLTRGGVGRRLGWPGVLLLVALASCTAASTRPAATPDAALLGYFPTDDAHARARFRGGCRRIAPGACGSWSLGGAGRDLTIEHAFFGGGGDRLLVIQSGIHGPEAPAGAAVQALVLDRHLPRLLARGIDVFLIHALNPYGVRYGRRTDAANVNLNRNFSPDGSAYRTRNPRYARYRELFEPSGPVRDATLASLAIGLRLVGAYLGAGFSAGPINEGLNSGQYEFPRGLNYGGAGPAEQSAFLRARLAPVLARGYRKALFLDVHTGLGEAGVLAVLRGLRPPPALLGELEAMLRGYEREGIVVRSGEDPGFYPTTGDVIDFVPALSPEPDAVLAVTLEYGTLGDDALSRLRSAARLILENQAHFHGCTRREVCEAVARGFRELFNPSSPEWRLGVVRKAERVLDALVERY